MANYLYEDELMHYGVLGMKWGVRRNRSLTSRDKTRLERKRQSLRNKNQILSNKRMKQVKRSDKKLNYANNITIDWGNRGRYKMNSAMRLNAKANKKMKRIIHNELKISQIDQQLASNGEKYIKEKFKVRYKTDPYKRIVDYEMISKR